LANDDKLKDAPSQPASPIPALLSRVDKSISPSHPFKGSHNLLTTDREISTLDFIMPSANTKPRTLYDKVFQDHIVDEREDGTILLYIGMVTGYLEVSPQGLTPCRRPTSGS
jgi:hypothetical protein